ncbi:glyceraldehyde-3-phosphate dehydrogenase [Zhouia sp. PK063]|uniref:glyceraldehyde-3-phosphate dehydrogenase n=1 Tax=Zhouia sp. PK063 TaxID=3373602 RepID=UPI00379F61EB
MKQKSMFSRQAFQEQAVYYKEDLRKAMVLQGLIQELWYGKELQLHLFGYELLPYQPHEYFVFFKEIQEQYGQHLTVEQLLNIVIQLTNCNISAGTIELKALCNLETKVKINLSQFQCHMLQPIAKRDVVLFGFGRIGRLVARTLVAQRYTGALQLRAIVIRGKLDAASLQKRAALLKYDSVHGTAKLVIEVDEQQNALVINGIAIPVISSLDAGSIDYTNYGIERALIIDSSGIFRDKEALQIHQRAKGIQQVLLTAPGKGIPNIVFGVNHHQYNAFTDEILSAASCTTNAIAPVIKIIHETFRIVSGHIETIHAYTNDQNLVDNIHAKYRRGRAAAVNMVITETGAGTAIGKVIPELNGKLTSNAIRIPIPNGSLAILHLKLQTITDVQALNSVVRNYAFNGDLAAQLHFETSEELVSSDIIGNSHCAVFDSKATIVDSSGYEVTLYVWYDNEYGYTQQVIRIAQMMSQLQLQMT